VTLPEKFVVPPPVRVMLVSAVVPPTTPLKPTVPVPAASVRVCAPSTVLENVMLLLVVVSVVAAPSVTVPP